MIGLLHELHLVAVNWRADVVQIRSLHLAKRRGGPRGRVAKSNGPTHPDGGAAVLIELLAKLLQVTASAQRPARPSGRVCVAPLPARAAPVWRRCRCLRAPCFPDAQACHVAQHRPGGSGRKSSHFMSSESSSHPGIAARRGDKGDKRVTSNGE